MSIGIGLLANHPEHLVPLAAVYEREWHDWYGVHGDAMADLRERSRREGLPIGFVAFEQDSVAGAVAIAEESVRSHRHLTPWIVGFWVEPSRRNRGIGGQLLSTACSHAKGQGIATLYAATGAAATLFVREGWSMIDKGKTELGYAVDIFAKTLVP